jgi:hypothetical protein
MTAQDTGKFRTNEKDQFYTRPAVAKRCVDLLVAQCGTDSLASYLWIEPSAGKGVFLDAVPPGTTALGLDIEPRASQIQKQDFLKWKAPAAGGQPILLFGNPPFGRQSSLAKKFLKHGSTFADIMAFILPLSFQKASMSDAIPLQFHCLLTEVLNPDSFEVNGASHPVPCIFQIWRREMVPRQKAVRVSPVGFSYIQATRTDVEPHVAFRRVGGKAGTMFSLLDPGAPDRSAFAAQAHHFLRFEPQFVPHIPAIIARTNAHVFPTNTVGPRSLSTSEINVVLNRICAEVVAAA